MNIAVLGTGDVGRTIASRLVELGHHVHMGSRSADHEGGRAWAEAAGERASLSTFADAAAFGQLVFLCVKGGHAKDVLKAAGADNLRGKAIADVSNPLDFSNGFPPTLSVVNDDSAAEQLQRAFPDAKIVKALNTMACAVMVRPRALPDQHHTFLSGDHDDAKVEVRAVLEEFGWAPDEILDLGDLSSARGTEMFLPLWLRLYGKVGRKGRFNIKVVSADDG